MRHAIDVSQEGHMTRRIDLTTTAALLAIVVSACGSAPTPTSTTSAAIPLAATPVAATPAASSATPTPLKTPSEVIERDEAIAIARRAAGDMLSWLEDYPVSSAEMTPFGELRTSFDPMPVPDLPDDRPVWSIVLANAGAGQGATIYVDATSGAVLRAVTWISSLSASEAGEPGPSLALRS